MTDKYEITILNWEKYQKDIKGQRRNWVAISTDLLHDPDFVELTMEQRYLWIAMLLHAGRVGHVYKLSISSARLLFKLRPSWRGVVDFEALRNQGFIDFQNATRQGRQDKTRHKEKIYKKESKKVSKKKPSKTVPEEWKVTEKGRQLAQELGFSAAQTENQLANFRDYEYRSPKTDFDACWRTWIRKAAEWRQDKPSTHDMRPVRDL